MNRNEMEQGVKLKKKGRYDYTLLFLVIVLVMFGLVMIYSVSYYNANKYYSDPYMFLRKQSQAALLGLVAMVIVSKIDYKKYYSGFPVIKVRLLVLLYIVCFAAQVYVAAFGKETGGSSRWIDLGAGFKFQPSEVTKICVVVWAAYIAATRTENLYTIIGFAKNFVFVIPLALLVVIENMSTAIIIIAVYVAVMFVASKNKKYYFIVALGLLGAGLIFLKTFAYRMKRIDIWRNIETHPDGYQIRQGMYGIASGGLFGKGLGNGVQKLGYIPEAHNDMIFATICEELGLVGAIFVFILFAILFWRILQVAVNAKDLFGSLLATGVLVQLALQFIINTAVVTNTIPSTGIALPFISYGGTSLVFLMMEIGIVLSVSNQIQTEQ